jgi:predicted AlkP superfamily phosphohydrolase/phosphomutase
MILFGESDGICHHYWKWCDPRSPLYQAQPPGLQDSILQIYQALDREIGEILALAPPETTLMMMSDHGFGGVTNWVMYPNCWLRQIGCLAFRSATRRWLSRFLEQAKLGAVNFLPVRLKRALYRMGRRKLGEVEALVRFGSIDWASTTAYFDENPYYPAIWINLRGRQPKGIVDPGRPYEELRDQLLQQLESWRHPHTGDRIVEKAFRREEVYSGPHVEEAPDIIVKWALLDGYSYAFRLSSKSRDKAWIEQLDPQKPQAHEFFTGKSGNHRDNGIFLAQGPTIRAGASIEGARIIDLAPTILQLLGVPIPPDMDGHALQDIFTEWPVEEAPAIAAANGCEAPVELDSHYSPEDEEMISERLKSLGYVE